MRAAIMISSRSKQVYVFVLSAYSAFSASSASNLNLNAPGGLGDAHDYASRRPHALNPLQCSLRRADDWLQLRIGVAPRLDDERVVLRCLGAPAESIED